MASVSVEARQCRLPAFTNSPAAAAGAVLVATVGFVLARLAVAANGTIAGFMAQGSIQHVSRPPTTAPILAAVNTSSPPMERPPPGRMLELPGRGRAFIRQHEGPPGSPTLLLLHGWTVTADINWGPSYAGLGERFSLLTLDQRGHGQGIGARKPFTLEDAADDAVALIRATATGRAILVGYSMGGPIAQLIWRRNPEVVGGMVLCSTAVKFGGGPFFYGGMLAMSRLTRFTPSRISRPFVANFAKRRFAGLTMADWARDQVAPNNTSQMFSAGWAIGGFDSGPWIGEVDVPTSVVITTEDRTVSPQLQRSLAGAIPGADVFEVAAGHGVCLVDPDLYVPVLLKACESVVRRRV